MHGKLQVDALSVKPNLHDIAHRRLLALVAGLTSIVLVMTAHTQIYDTNFMTLWEATALLNGDHPYRDFFEWGLPGQMVVSAAAQLLVGHRLIGEFLVQWLFIVAGVVLSFHVGLRLTRSVWASLVTTLLALLLLAVTPTYTYPKIFFYPLAVWLLWRYIETPSAGRSAVLGLTTAVAFLFRHDHGVYIGVATALAFVLTRLFAPSFRSMRALARDAGAYSATAAAILAPWLIVVHMSEGLSEYVQLRAELFDKFSADGFVYALLLTVNPMQALRPTPEAALTWLCQIVMVIPILLLLQAAFDLLHRWRRAEAVTSDTYCMIVAAVLLVVVDSQTLRTMSYSLHVFPVTAALSTRLLVASRGTDRDTCTRHPRIRFRTVWLLARGALVLATLLVTTVTTVVFTRSLLSVDELLPALRPAFQHLLASPPIDGYEPTYVALGYDREAWEVPAGADSIKYALRYMRECTREGDRILVTGSTPLHVNYYTGRSIAGGHLFWHRGWRADPVHESRSLALLQRQSVPFAFSTTEPLLDDFTGYPSIHEYLVNNYVEVGGNLGYILVDKRRTPTGRFGTLGLPCFR